MSEKENTSTLDGLEISSLSPAILTCARLLSMCQQYTAGTKEHEWTENIPGTRDAFEPSPTRYADEY